MAAPPPGPATATAAGGATLAVMFARQVCAGQVKTRLIGPMTAEQAADIHRLGVLAAWEAVRASGLAAAVAFTPDDAAAAFERLLGPQEHCWPQGDGALGQRLERAVERAAANGFERVILLGCDCPGLSARHLRDAAAKLTTHDVVLGPARDGGYYLLGLRLGSGDGAPRWRALFEGIDWGTERVAAHTRAQAKRGGLVCALLRELRDLDRWEDVVWHAEHQPPGRGAAEDLRRRLCELRCGPAAAFSPRQAQDGTAMSDAGDRVITVLIVDDNPQNLELLEAYLESAHYRTIRASSGSEALALVAARPPDLILLDVMMPRMSGFEVCKTLKSNPGTRDIPVLMVTALNEISDVERGNDSGTDDFLSKPFTRQELLNRVESLLRSTPPKG